MTVRIKVTLEGDAKLRRALSNLSPRENAEFRRKALRKAAYAVQKNATTEQIIRGGKQAPHPTRVTSRTGTLRRSIAVDFGQLPRSVAIGTDLIYGALHELGGTVKRTRKGSRRRHRARYPARPYLQPAAIEVSRNTLPRILEAEWIAAVESTR